MDINISEKAWTTWQGLNKAIQGKEVVFFGVSDDWTGKTLRNTLIKEFSFVDNSKTWQGAEYIGAKIKSPKILKENVKSRYVIISSSAYESIYPQLIEYGLTPGDNFCITPALNNLKVITDINTHKARILLSSPDHKIYSQLDNSNDVGGGLFTYDIQSHECKKVLDGTFHQIVDTGKSYYIVDEIRGICEVSKDFELKDSFGVEKGDKPHGVAFCPKRDLVFLARTGRDFISVFNAKTKKIEFDILFSGKMTAAKKPGHWINDIFVNGDYLYVSLFSQTGSSREGVFDGGVLQISIDNPKERHVLMNDLWLPHSVCFFDADICVLDSMRGHFYKTDKNIVGEFFGFIRGLAFDGAYYYIGQSETRYFDRLKGIRKNIGMSAGFYLFDEDTKAAKFFSIPKLRQVRSLCVI
ncbi:hypothetical protein HRM2_36750 [Desulforapulum autotrophicum HRM2]|uniref:Conserved hypothetical protein CHP03032 domain-containing protein n=1 Tax=Desulforapulum autotrophicum (strain ATCC 43914 / DSM 3382 / VKM B-1955 / HRM2) TaxID=177437 RepID=C0QA15_DESAH|nr:DUF4915 domain-containing protein [Desulforapulum autotrophicum]ACN16733.1 hypothetical protein HRM2_36750 [Desulforapulum autotrophicum HRM2]